MPIFEYKCLNCQKNFEKLVLSHNKDNISCPYCSSSKIDKQLSLCSFNLSRRDNQFTSSSSCSTCTSKNCSSCR